MNWIITSFLMFGSSIIYYLIVKKAQLSKIENKFYMVANFSIPAVLFFALNLNQQFSMVIPFKFIIAILLQSFFLSYIGAAIGYVAINKAPNAGYSLVIQKSYAIYTSFAAIYLFNSSLTLKKLFAILIVLVSSAIISITRGKHIRSHHYMWVFLSLISFFCYGTAALVNKYIISQGVPSPVLLFWVMIFVTLISSVDLFIHRTKAQFHATPHNVLLLFLIGFSVFFFYYFKQISEVAAPNIGYVNAINTASNAAYTILVALIFKDHLSWKKMIAVLGVTLGLILLVT